MRTEFNRLKALLRKATPLTDEYDKLLKEMSTIADFLYIDGVIPTASTTTEEVSSDPSGTYSTETSEEYLYTKEAVREILSDATKNGLDVRPLLSKYIPEGKPAKFSSVPASSYSQLVKDIEDAR